MRIVKSLAVLAAATLCISGTAQAGVHIKITSQSFLAKEGACDQFAGNWHGYAVIEKVCKYTGTAAVSHLSEPGRYHIHVELSPAGGYFWCPKSDPVELQGACNGSNITIDEPKAVHLDGTTDGSSIHLSGSIDASGKTLHVDSLDLNKQ